MSDISIQTLLKEAEQLTKKEKIELVNFLAQQLETHSPKSVRNNLADFFQNSPLVGIDLDLSRHEDPDNRAVHL
ncbi:hypothetical protein [Merismopedia glauca]|uniref:Uncharacterized protein n=1 Tax=Merismopedia glauca CCAP 1448/3 TaxID=1296344 RepID=A0A2T1C035_9CYAN|nr:hypothetical protein [Merismopedia glauca]PSB01483.1 hypothetical protein C7B64_18130 [Merismopedia glauca CCAP 1448/3]